MRIQQKGLQPADFAQCCLLVFEFFLSIASIPKNSVSKRVNIFILAFLPLFLKILKKKRTVCYVLTLLAMFLKVQIVIEKKKKNSGCKGDLFPTQPCIIYVLITVPKFSL